MTIVFPYICFCLNISYTTIAVAESTFVYGESSMKISASETNVLARAIF